MNDDAVASAEKVLRSLGAEEMLYTDGTHVRMLRRRHYQGETWRGGKRATAEGAARGAVQEGTIAMSKCHACKFSFMEPDDMNLTCGHPDAGTFGKYVHRATDRLNGHCGPDRTKFEQHPLRNEDGSLKPRKGDR